MNEEYLKKLINVLETTNALLGLIAGLLFTLCLTLTFNL